MQRTLRSPLVLALLTAVGAWAADPAPPLDDAAAGWLDGLRALPDRAGARIYRGDVFALVPVDVPALFHYERRVNATPAGLRAAHITYDMRGAALIVEAATVSPDYTLQRFDMANRQTGNSGSAVVSADGRHVDFTLRQHTWERVSREAIDEPLVSGPSLHGFVLQHWDTLAGGASVPVRLVVLEALKSYGFDVRLAQRGDNGHTTFAITPSSWLVRLVVAPLRVTFDNATRQVLFYEGRVPPMQEVDGKLQPMDARVRYSAHAPRYR